MIKKKLGGKFELDDLIQLSVDNDKDSSCQSETELIGSFTDSVKKKRKKSEPFRKTLERLLSLRVTSATVSQAIFLSPLGNDITYQEAILLAQVIKASNGDNQAASFIRDCSGNKQNEEAEKERCIKFEDL